MRLSIAKHLAKRILRTATCISFGLAVAYAPVLSGCDQSADEHGQHVNDISSETTQADSFRAFLQYDMTIEDGSVATVLEVAFVNTGEQTISLDASPSLYMTSAWIVYEGQVRKYREFLEKLDSGEYPSHATFYTGGSAPWPQPDEPLEGEIISGSLRIPPGGLLICKWARECSLIERNRAPDLSSVRVVGKWHDSDGTAKNKRFDFRIAPVLPNSLYGVKRDTSE
jgi:hypothetical protein